MKNIWIAMVLVCALFGSACEKNVINRGVVFDSVDYKKVIVGKDDAVSVFNKIGSPTFRSSVSSENGEYSWYYVSKRTEKNGFLDPKIVDQNTVIITFSKSNKVISVNTSSVDKEIKSVKDTTKTAGKTAGVFGETFGGLGKYLKPYMDKNKGKK